MHKIIVIAMREYRSNVKSKAFLIAIFLVPVLMFGGLGMQIFMKSKGDTETKKVAVRDRSGIIFEAITKAAEHRNANSIFDGETGKQIQSKFEMIQIRPGPQDSKEELIELSDQVRAEKYFAFVEIDGDIVSEDRTPSDSGIRYYTNQQAYRELPRWISAIVNTCVKESRFAAAGLDRKIVEDALAPIQRQDLDLVTRTETGQIEQAKEADRLATFMVPFILMMLMFMALMVTTQPMLNGVLEEKMQRIAEVLLGSVPPFELMLGKILGHLLVALTLLLIYFSGAYFVANHFGAADLVEGRLIAWFLAFMTLGIVMFGSLFLAAGSCCNDVKEAQSLIMPVMFPMMVPLFCIVPIIEAPNGTFATIMSLVPIWSPMAMVMRLGMPTGVPTWQPLAAMGGCLIASVLAIWGAGRIFRVGLLMAGKPPKMSQMLKWVIKG